MRPPRLVVIGHAGHGKDTVCELIAELYSLKFISSSMAALDAVIYPALKDKYGYTSKEECFADRINHRTEWHELIKEYNAEDKTRLGRLIFSNADIYCGLRNKDELRALKQALLVDFVIWVDGSHRLPDEPISSFNITAGASDFMIDNNDTEDMLLPRVRYVMNRIVQEHAARLANLENKEVDDYD